MTFVPLGGSPFRLRSLDWAPFDSACLRLAALAPFDSLCSLRVYDRVCDRVCDKGGSTTGSPLRYDRVFDGISATLRLDKPASALRG